MSYSYYVELGEMRVVVRSRFRAGTGRQEWIHTGTAELCELRDGQLLSPEQLAALRKRSVNAYRAAPPPTDEIVSEVSPPRSASAMRADVPAPSTPSATHLRIDALRLVELARTVSIVFTILGVIGVIGGISIALQETTTFRNGFGSTTERHNVALGLTIAVASAVQAAFALVITNAAALFAGYVEHRLSPGPAATPDPH